MTPEIEKGIEWANRWQTGSRVGDKEISLIVDALVALKADHAQLTLQRNALMDEAVVNKELEVSRQQVEKLREAFVALDRLQDDKLLGVSPLAPIIIKQALASVEGK